jgi:hypothetical protein
MLKSLISFSRHSKRARSASEVSDLEPSFLWPVTYSGDPNHAFRFAARAFGMTAYSSGFAQMDLQP